MTDQEIRRKCEYPVHNHTICNFEECQSDLFDIGTAWCNSFDIPDKTEELMNMVRKATDYYIKKSECLNKKRGTNE